MDPSRIPEFDAFLEAPGLRFEAVIIGESRVVDWCPLARKQLARLAKELDLDVVL